MEVDNRYVPLNVVLILLFEVVRHETLLLHLQRETAQLRVEAAERGRKLAGEAGGVCRHLLTAVFDGVAD